jgi:hypothetical protein
MKKILFFSLLAFTAVCFASIAMTCCAQTSIVGCGDFKTGRFAYRDSSGHIIEVKRKGNRQQEYDKTEKITTKFKIKWTGECEYQLTQIWSDSKAKRKWNRHAYRITITRVNSNDSYEYGCACREQEGRGIVGTMVRLE